MKKICTISVAFICLCAHKASAQNSDVFLGDFAQFNAPALRPVIMAPSSGHIQILPVVTLDAFTQMAKTAYTMVASKLSPSWWLAPVQEPGNDDESKAPLQRTATLSPAQMAQARAAGSPMSPLGSGRFGGNDDDGDDGKRPPRREVTGEDLPNPYTEQELRAKIAKYEMRIVKLREDARRIEAINPARRTERDMMLLPHIPTMVGEANEKLGKYRKQLIALINRRDALEKHVFEPRDGQ